MEIKLHISKGNMKMNVPNLSFTPGASCHAPLPCWKDCYARKACEVYAKNSAGVAWAENLSLWKTRPLTFVNQLVQFLNKKPLPRFRFHVGGDFPDMEYAKAMLLDIVPAFPETRFLAFSRFDPLWSLNHPKNFVAYRSYWIDEERPIEGRRQAQVVGKETTDVTGYLCPGNCKECGYVCWLGMGQVNFRKH
jgi:hypothetical protein